MPARVILVPYVLRPPGRGRGFGQVDLSNFPLASLTVTSPFGSRSPIAGSSVHSGIDYAAAVGTPVYAAAAGTVQFSGQQSGFGNVVYIDHGGGVVTIYGHLSELDVSQGQAVAGGQQIGLSGQSGLVTGPHLHFEVRVNGVAVDPASSIMSASLAQVVPSAGPGVYDSDPGDASTAGLDFSSLSFLNNLQPVTLALGGALVFVALDTLL